MEALIYPLSAHWAPLSLSRIWDVRDIFFQAVLSASGNAEVVTGNLFPVNESLHLIGVNRGLHHKPDCYMP